MISSSHPRSSGMSRSGLVFTPWMRGCLAVVSVYTVGLLISPPDAHFGIVAQHEPVRARLDRLAIDADVSPDQAVDYPVRQVAEAGSLEHDAVLDLRILDLNVVHDGR